MRSDVLIIGAGGAGLRAALRAKELGADVLVVSKEYATRSQTCMAQGGINASLSQEDSVANHIRDTLASAQGEADTNAVSLLCENAPKSVEWLNSIGVCFSRTKNATIAQRSLGGSSHKRACYAKDYTGLKILHTLYDKCLEAGIQIHQEKFLLELLQNTSGGVCGAKFLNIRDSKIEIYEAKAVVIATGGYSKVYSKHSTNSSASSGDGICVAHKAGASLLGMEFVQFHPTGLKSSSILISESARGAGAYLVNSQNKRFVDELGRRDSVSRAIYKEMQKGESVFLDLRHLEHTFIDEELPQESKLAKLYEDVDIKTQLLPIVPVAHYTMGGIEVNLSCESSLEGLYAVGECANHRVHGANRLGGNSLSEVIVFGEIAGENAARYAKQKEYEIYEEKVYDYRQNIREKIEIDFYEKRRELGSMMMQNVGLIRSKKRLKEALRFTKELESNLHLMGVEDSSCVYNTNLREYLEFCNRVKLSIEIIKGALAREKSCGAHFMEEEV